MYLQENYSRIYLPCTLIIPYGVSKKQDNAKFILHFSFYFWIFPKYFQNISVILIPFLAFQNAILCKYKRAVADASTYRIVLWHRLSPLSIYLFRPRVFWLHLFRKKGGRVPYKRGTFTKESSPQKNQITLSSNSHDKP